MLVLGRILALLGQAALTSSGLVKSRLETQLVQTAGTLLLALANAVLGGVTGCVVNLANTIRNVIWYTGHGTLAAKVVISIAIVALSAAGSDAGAFWLLPVASGLVFVWGIDLEGHGVKLMVLVSTLLWLPYDISLSNWTAAAFDVFGMALNAVCAWRIACDGKEETDRADAGSSGEDLDLDEVEMGVRTRNSLSGIGKKYDRSFRRGPCLGEGGPHGLRFSR